MEKHYTYNYFSYSNKSLWTPSIDLAWTRASGDVHVYENGTHVKTFTKEEV